MGGDLPPAVLPSFMLGWESSQARPPRYGRERKPRASLSLPLYALPRIFPYRSYIGTLAKGI